MWSSVAFARDPAYLDYIRGLNCAFCGQPGPSEPSHHGKHGTGIKPSDHEALPACRPCHRRHHQKGSPSVAFDRLTPELRHDVYRCVAEALRADYVDEETF